MVQIPSHKVLVVHDDLDLPTGKVRLRAKGGHGGHNGMRSITQHLKGSQDFPRLKIGIGRPAGQLPVASFVLQVGPFLTDFPIQVHTVSVAVAVASLAGLMYFYK
jgi:aminoacyl-tRNA hydrolase